MDGADRGSGSHDRGPADVDWPRGYGESSWWPIVTAAGAAGIYGGAGLLLLARGNQPLVGPVAGALAFVGGLGVFLGGLFGWSYHGFVSRYWHRSIPGGENRFSLGMVLFLCSEVMTFGAGFAFYSYVRVGPWPPGPLPDLLSSLVAANTALLVASSVTLHAAHGALRGGRRDRFLLLLGATVLLGAVFLLGQVYEYYEFVVREGFTLAEGVYASAFFGLTGLHGLHVGLGVVVLAIVLARGLAGQYSADRHASVTTATMYWHFVDAVWLLLVALLYVGATVSVPVG